VLTNTGTIRAALLDVVPRSVPVTAEQADAMAVELSTSRYDGLTAEAAYVEFALSRQLPNPESRERVPILVVSRPRALEVLCQTHTDAQGRFFIDIIDDAAAETVESQRRAIARAMKRAMGWDALYLLNPQTQAMLAGAIALNLVSQEVVALATTEPDPAWEPTVFDPAPSDVILGTDALPEWDEFLAAWTAKGG